MRTYDELMETRIRHLHAEREMKLTQSRLARAALEGQSVRVISYKPLLANIGKRMVIWGTRLQRRYTDARYLSELELQFYSE